jgi:hypothetical protein
MHDVVIQTTAGPEVMNTVEVCGNWAVHYINIAFEVPSPDSFLWTVTYVPLGLRLPVWTTQESAITLAIWLEVQVPEYDRANTAHKAEVIRNIKRIKAVYEPVEHTTPKP